MRTEAAFFPLEMKRTAMYRNKKAKRNAGIPNIPNKKEPRIFPAAPAVSRQLRKIRTAATNARITSMSSISWRRFCSCIFATAASCSLCFFVFAVLRPLAEVPLPPEDVFFDLTDFFCATQTTPHSMCRHSKQIDQHGNDTCCQTITGITAASVSG